MLEKSFRNKSQRHSFLLLSWQGWISPSEHVSRPSAAQKIFLLFGLRSIMMLMMIIKKGSFLKSPGLVVVVSPVLFLLELQRVKIWFIAAGKFASLEKYSDWGQHTALHPQPERWELGGRFWNWNQLYLSFNIFSLHCKSLGGILIWFQRQVEFDWCEGKWEIAVTFYFWKIKFYKSQHFSVCRDLFEYWLTLLCGSVFKCLLFRYRHCVLMHFPKNFFLPINQSDKSSAEPIRGECLCHVTGGGPTTDQSSLP